MIKYTYWIRCAVVIFCCVFLWNCGKNNTDNADDSAEVAEEIAALERQQPTVLPADTSTSELPANAVAMVNGQVISSEEFTAQLHSAIAQLDASSTPPDEYTVNRLKENLLTDMVEKMLIAQKAKEQNISVSEDEFQQLIQQTQQEYNGVDILEILKEQNKSYDEWAKEQRETLLLEKLVDLNMASMIDVADAEVQQHYDRNKEKYDHPAQIRASQILTVDENTARQALQEIQKGEDFANVAEKYSTSDDAQNGGDLGFFSQGVMPSEFDQVLFALKVGEVSDVVKTPYGYQIFKLTDKRDAQQVPFDEVKEQIRSMLKKQKRMFAIDVWKADLREKSKILLNQEFIKQIQ